MDLTTKGFSEASKAMVITCNIYLNMYNANNSTFSFVYLSQLGMNLFSIFEGEKMYIFSVAFC